MNYLNKKIKAILFDLDGVILDTESQYSEYWNLAGKKYLDKENLGEEIKGQSLRTILNNHFSNDKLVSDIALKFPNNSIFDKIASEVDQFEAMMKMPYIAGALDFIKDLKKTDVKLAVVTSSSSNKMKAVKKQHPELYSLFDRIFTAEEYKRGKPAPDCFLLGANYFNVLPNECIVFEDSFFGLQAAKSANMAVVGLATTNPANEVEPLCDLMLNNFLNFSPEILFTFFNGKNEKN